MRVEEVRAKMEGDVHVLGVYMSLGGCLDGFRRARV